MREARRRDVLRGSGLALAGALAGCAGLLGDGATAETPTPTTDPTPTATPTPRPDRILSVREWLPTPEALSVERYTVGNLFLAPMRRVGADERLLDPSRYAPRALSDATADTDELLTISNRNFGAGVLVGAYDTDAIGEALESAGYESAAGPVDVERFTAGASTIDVGAERLLWAEREADSAGTIDGLRERRDGAGESYPASNRHFAAVLDAIEPAHARFAIEVVESEREDNLAGARFRATGMEFTEDVTVWRIAVSYEDAPPEGAMARYREEFEERLGFSDVRTRIDGGLLELSVATSPGRATTVEPL